MTSFPTSNDPNEILTFQARDLVQVMSISGFTRENAMRVCLRMRVIMRDMTDEQFKALNGGASIKPVEAKQ